MVLFFPELMKFYPIIEGNFPSGERSSPCQKFPRFLLEVQVSKEFIKIGGITRVPFFPENITLRNF
jgi:hypothetical protein